MAETFAEAQLAAQGLATPWADAFFQELMRMEGDVDAASAVVNVSVPELMALREKNKSFDERWKRATSIVRKIRAERLETQAYADAVVGNSRFKFTPQGTPVAHPETGEPYYEVERSDRLQMFLLKALDRSTFGDRQELTGKDGGPIQSQTLVATLADIARIADGVRHGRIDKGVIVAELVEEPE
jgi:hypothetical protein